MAQKLTPQDAVRLLEPEGGAPQKIASPASTMILALQEIETKWEASPMTHRIMTEVRDRIDVLLERQPSQERLFQEA